LSEPRPSVVILAGPNGAGKSTAAPALLQGALNVTEFVNADVIARGLSGFNVEGAAIAAGRVMLARLRELARHRVSFAFETTLASRSLARRLVELKREGYSVHIIFLWLSSAELAIERVADRVRMGGHSVPADAIRRRYRAGVRNFLGLYEPLASTWRLYDNSGDSPKLIAARLIAARLDISSMNVYDEGVWASVARQRTDNEG
jgi:predicted ABC-type ATPase